MQLFPLFRRTVILAGLAAAASAALASRPRQQTAPAVSPPPAEQFLAPQRTSLVGELPAELAVKRVERTGHLLVSPRINGEEAGWFIFDTGAGLSCADNNLIERLGLPEAGQATARGSGGHQPTSFRAVKTLELGPLKLEGSRVVELELAPISLAVGEELAGVIGYDCLSGALWEIDLAGGRIVAHDPTEYELPAGAQWHELRLESRRPSLAGQIEQNPAGRFVIDTGANTAIAVHAPAVKQFDLLNGRETRAAMMGGVGGMRQARSGKLASIAIAGQRLEDVTATFAAGGDGGAMDDDAIQATVGIAALRNWVLVIDYAGQRAALLAPPDAKQPASD